jgi:hypothetical protein
MTDDVILRFAHHFATLNYVNLQNKQLICQVSHLLLENVQSSNVDGGLQFSPVSLLPLVSEASQLRDLRVCLVSMSNEMLRKLAQHRAIRHLSLLCRRQEKFEHSDLGADEWDQLVAATDEQLAVTLRFDCACGLNLTLAKVCTSFRFVTVKSAREKSVGVPKYRTYTQNIGIDYFRDRPGNTIHSTIVGKVFWDPD